MTDKLNVIADGVAQLPVSIANVYFVGDPNGKWVLVDAGVPVKARIIRQAAEARFGPGSRPQCILLTHGHFDHSGSALDLANFWDIPVYAHALEMPYLSGKSDYPPADPTAPGFMAFLSRFFPAKTVDLSSRIRTLEAGAVPNLPDWEWVHTPGHTPGHVSFFRKSDATLLAGDAFATVNLDSPSAVLSKKQSVSLPPVPMTCDWRAASESVRKLADLHPLTLAAGHGTPMSGPAAAAELAHMAYRFPVPAHGRYTDEPARTDERGIVSLPPPPPDRAPGIAGAMGIAAITGAMFAIAAKRRPASGGYASLSKLRP